MPDERDDLEMAALLADYIGLYTRDTLPRWRTLFLPSFVAAATNDDGSVSTWSLDDFYERQRASFSTGKPVSEVLEDVCVNRSGDLASVRANFTWTDGGTPRRGRLMLLAIAERERFRIHALTFSYHP